MTTDRELLELAARAAALDYHLDYLDGTPKILVDGRLWNPLLDDGDALRLAVKLEIDFYISDDDGAATYAGWYGSQPNANRQRFAVEQHKKSGPCAATRRAIVRAAAEIGRNKK